MLATLCHLNMCKIRQMSWIVMYAILSDQKSALLMLFASEDLIPKYVVFSSSQLLLTENMHNVGRILTWALQRKGV